MECVGGPSPGPRAGGDAAGRAARPGARIRKKGLSGATARRPRRARLGPPGLGRRRRGDHSARARGGKDPRKFRLSRISEGTPREATAGISRPLKRSPASAIFGRSSRSRASHRSGSRGVLNSRWSRNDLHSVRDILRPCSRTLHRPRSFIDCCSHRRLLYIRAIRARTGARSTSALARDRRQVEGRH
jgi:hypothetical protein